MRTSPSLLLLLLTTTTTTASPAPVWDRILNSLSHFSPSLFPPQLPLSPPSPPHTDDTNNNDHNDNNNDNKLLPGSLRTTHLPAFTTTIYAKTATPLPLPAPWDIFYPEEEEDPESDLSKRQCTNSGVQNSGCDNSGNYNTGNGNSGNYNCGNGNSGNYNGGNGQSGNGGSGSCGNVVISQSVAYVYPAPSTVVVQVAPVTQIVTVAAPVVYTTYVVYQQPPATTVVYQPAQVVPIVQQETYAPRGCAYWEALGYRCSAASGIRSNLATKGMIAAGVVFWGSWLVLM
ncbi:hypothetical protein TWF694_005122 [Orbilia ellipsospora]|uniref:Uncharacterized protein n=1 Tax=Orbilia ellipsospora TaxID=2528407 RepID=A0AAV9WUN9_9PEZI